MLMSLMKFEGYLRDRWPFILSTIICAVLVFYAYGCEAKTDSLICPGQQVNRDELMLEIETLLKTTTIRVEDLDKQEKLRQVIFNQALVIAQDGSINPIGLMTSLLAVFGIGAAADDVRLRKQRKKTLVYEPTKPNAS